MKKMILVIVVIGLIVLVLLYTILPKCGYTGKARLSYALFYNFPFYVIDPKYCDRSCNTDKDCEFSCACGAINKNEKCDVKGIEVDCFGRYWPVKCENKKCIIFKEKPEGVTITTDKTEYLLGDHVQITIQNQRTEPIYRYPYDLSIEEFTTESSGWTGWKNVLLECSNPCICTNDSFSCPPESPGALSELENSFMYIWNQTSCVYEEKICNYQKNKYHTYKEGALKPVSSGEFKAKFCYWENKEDITSMSFDARKCIEKEFTIK